MEWGIEIGKGKRVVKWENGILKRKGKNKLKDNNENWDGWS